MSDPCPLPAYSQDVALAELRTAELFVVASARLWVAPLSEPHRAHPDWRQGFRAAAIDGMGFHGFDTLFTIVANAAQRSLDIRSPRRPTLGADEVRLLLLIGLLQTERRDDAAAILDEWLPPAAARAALPAAAAFAQSLALSRLWIPSRPGIEAGEQVHVAAVYANRGLVLVQ